jgi:hypothetical protein
MGSGHSKTKNKEMKRYLIFSFPDYYPCGGIGDVIGKYEHLADAKDALNSAELSPYISSDNCYIWDCMADEKVLDLYNDMGQ